MYLLLICVLYNYFLETTSLEGCDLCDPGWYCDAPGLTTPRAPCDPGYVCYEGAYTSDPTDGVTGEICPAGGYCPLGKVEVQLNRNHKCNMEAKGEAGRVAVLPRRYAPMGPGSILRPGAVCAFGFQSILASAGFLQVLRFSLLHLKLDFLNKSVSKHHIEASFEFNAFAVWDLPGFLPNVINKNK